MGYTKGLHEIADGVWAYLQPDGGWGWSNAGLITGDGSSLLVDTLFDLRLTAEMLESMRAATPQAERIGTVVNTHANGDHCYGNSLLGDAEIIATARCAEEMLDLPPATMAALLASADALGATGRFVQRIFSPFSFEDVPLTVPTRTFEDRLDLQVGGRAVSLLQVGPAHTAGDAVVHLPDAGIVFTGDILFHGGHPIVWAGPVSNWIAACDLVLALQPTVVVPGHGPRRRRRARGPQGVFRTPDQRSQDALEAGMSPLDAARDIDLGPYAEWSEGERVVANVHALYRDFGDQSPADALTLLGEMAAFAG